MSFTILTGAIDQFRSDKPLADSTLLNPLVAIPLIQGEWLFNSSTGYARIAAVAGNDVVAGLAHGKPVPVFSERGDASIQAIGKVPVIEHGGSYRAKTNVFKTVDGTSLGAIDGASVLNMELTVAALETDIPLEPHVGRTVLREAASTHLVVARLHTLPVGGFIEIDVLPSPYIKP